MLYGRQANGLVSFDTEFDSQLSLIKSSISVTRHKHPQSF